MLSFTSSPDAAQNIQTMRLRDDPSPQRHSKKRKSPPADVPDQPQYMQFPVFNPATFAPPAPLVQPPLRDQQQQPEASASAQNAPSPPNQRTLSSSKRAEQNRKAQRAFRERRDQHVKALESRSQLLDAALSSADEANRRWEECRALVDQLRVENAALRAALSQAHLLPPNLAPGQPLPPPQDNKPEPSTDTVDKEEQPVE